MKIIDRYVARNFLIGYLVAFCVLMGLRIIIDLFVNLDEFTEHTDMGTAVVLRNILAYYALNTTLYFRDFAGMITVVAAAFSLSRMVHKNELVAVMASGVSLKRVIAPILVLGLAGVGIQVIDQELIIPSLGYKLVRSQDAIPGRESYKTWFLSDGKGSLICSERFDVATATLYSPTIILRSSTAPPAPQGPADGRSLGRFVGHISAEKATYNYQTGRWDLAGGTYIEKDSYRAARPVGYYESDLTPKDIPIRTKAEHKDLLSTAQLSAFLKQPNKLRDITQLTSQKHFRVTDPAVNFIMLLISLPILVCRDPRTMKSAIIISFALTGACIVVNFACKIIASEVIFNRAMPGLWAWLAVFIFLPIAFVELDSMKT